MFVAKTLSSLAIVVLVVVGPFAHAESTSSLESRVSELEANQSLNVLRFSGSLINRHDTIAYRQNMSAAAASALQLSQPVDSQDINVDRLKFELNVDAEVAKNIKFYSTLATSKTWNMFNDQNDTLYSGTYSQKELGGAEAGREPEVQLQKAYLDYSLTSLPLVVSVGRLPTFGGPPKHLWNAQARMGTYPMLAYNAMLDGAALTYKLDSLLGSNQKLALRYIYSPFSDPNRIGIVAEPTYTGSTVRGTSQSPAYTYMIDYSLKTSFWDDFTAIVQYMDIRPFNLGDSTATVSGSVIGQNSGNLVTLPTISTASAAYNFLTIYAGVENLLHSGFDFNVTYLNTNVYSAGNFTLLGNNIGGYLSSGTQPNTTLNGSVYLLSTRYRIPAAYLNKPYVGLEYQSGSNNSNAQDFMAEDYTGFYINRGTGYHLYYTHLISDNLIVRLGYMFQNQKQIAPIGSIGALQNSDNTFSTVYLTGRLNF